MTPPPDIEELVKRLREDRHPYLSTKVAGTLCNPSGPDAAAALEAQSAQSVKDAARITALETQLAEMGERLNISQMGEAVAIEDRDFYRAQLAEFREVAKPFSEAALNLPEPYCDVLEIGSLRDFNLWESAAAMGLNASDLIRVRALMAALKKTEEAPAPEDERAWRA